MPAFLCMKNPCAYAHGFTFRKGTMLMMTGAFVGVRGFWEVRSVQSSSTLLLVMRCCIRSGVPNRQTKTSPFSQLTITPIFLPFSYIGRTFDLPGWPDIGRTPLKNFLRSMVLHSVDKENPCATRTGQGLFGRGMIHAVGCFSSARWFPGSERLDICLRSREVRWRRVVIVCGPIMRMYRPYLCLIMKTLLHTPFSQSR